GGFMKRAFWLLPGLMVTMALGLGAQEQQGKKDALEPLIFLAGTWHGEGKGPYGAYEFETHVERRGRWLLLTSNVFVPGTDRLMFVSTQIYGYDNKGLVLHLFDTAGAFLFRGEPTTDGARFAWKGADNWKRLELDLRRDGSVRSRYDAHEPAMFKEPVTFEGIWLPGKRAAKE
ncbi:MAG TPA: hypothetical protein VIC04_04160, partial [Terriglobia bacterium]